jgi:hypothetical protein
MATGPAPIKILPVNDREARALAGAYDAELEIVTWTEYRLTCRWTDQKDSSRVLTMGPLSAVKAQAIVARDALGKYNASFAGCSLALFEVTERTLTTIEQDFSEDGDGECRGWVRTVTDKKFSA